MTAASVAATHPEMWGGVECTVNRVGDTYFDQMEQSGHAGRLSDLDRFAALGLTTLRYPVLWERTAPNGIENADWSWPDERLGRLRELGIRPIVGLVHHGSGPRHTSLMDARFPEKLAEYAGAVAARYPWTQDYTPINEPLTTARFSGLYGHWYPHARSDAAFVQALITQCRATVLAMRAIRKVNPDARLIQTEDIGQAFSTPPLQYQADFENERRWLTFDLLCGKVTRDHPLREYLLWAQAGQETLEWLSDNPCPPGLLGVDYYLNSERFLDDRLHRYPAHLHGGNDRQAYVDIEAVRVRPEGICGVRAVIRDAWERYGIPIAVTECHLGCTEDEQARWLAEVWGDVRAIAAEGIPFEGVTVWSLLGAYDWNSLVTRGEGIYEPGAFDVRSGGGVPKPTPLAALVQALATGDGDYKRFVPAGPGWWRKPERLLYVEDRAFGREEPPRLTPPATRRKSRLQRTAERGNRALQHA